MKIDFNKLYKKYDELYRSSKSYLAKQSLKMVTDKLTETQFRAMYRAQYNTLKDTVERPSVAMVLNKLVERQTYIYSEKQAELVERSLRARGIKPPSKATVRSKAGEVIEEMIAMNEELKAENPEMDGYDRAHFIAYVFFNSDGGTDED